MVIRSLSLLLLLTLTLPIWGAQISVKPDRNPVKLNESFTLTFQSNGKPNGDPDFTPLEKSFSILSRSSSTAVQWINGRQSEQYNWQLTLMAESSGKLTIPPISFGQDNSAALTLTVQEAESSSEQQSSELLLEVAVDQSEVYVGEQVILTLRLLRMINIANASLSEPEFASGSAEVVKLGDDSRYELKRGEHRYAVVEQRYALFPQQAGTLTTKPVRFEGMVATGSRLGLALFNQEMQVKRLFSDSVTLQVKEPPISADHPLWLPAQQLNFRDHWSQEGELRVGEPVTRTVILEADGVTLKRLPDIHLTTPDGSKGYPDQPEFTETVRENRVRATRTGRIAYIPTAEGVLNFPAQQIEWWSSEQQQWQQALLPARQFKVLPPLPGSVAPPVTPQNTPPASHLTVPLNGVVEQQQAWRWHRLDQLLALGWGVTLLLWYGHYRFYRTHPRTISAPLSLGQRRQQLQQIQQALQQDNPKVAEQALLHWGQMLWPSAPPRTLGDLQRLLPELLAEAVTPLHTALYHPQAAVWRAADGVALWRRLAPFKPAAHRPRAATQFTPLYPVRR